MASLGAIIAIIVVSVGGLVLLVLGAMMMIGAIMPKKSVITSWPQQQEQAFATFDERIAGSQSKAWIFAIVSGIGVFVIISGIYLAVPPEKHDIGKTMNMSNLTKKDGAGAPAKAPPPKIEKKEPESKPEVKQEEKKPEETKPEEKKPAEKPAEAPKKK
jgi:outer membrane biosynthesis protein TonB